MLKKTIRRLGALAMVLAMAVSVFAVNASAATGVIGGTGTELKEITLTKNLTIKEDGALAPNATATFEVTLPSEDTTKTVTESGVQKTYKVNKGITGGLLFDATHSNTITFTQASTRVTGQKYAQDTTKLKVDASVFTAPGIYRYIVKESSVTGDGVTKDDTVYYVDLYVENGDVVNGKQTYKVTAAEVLNNTNNNAKSDLVFDNEYETGALTVKKEVKGTLGDKTHEWEIKVTIKSSASATETVKEKYTAKLSDGTEVTLTSGDEYTFNLAHDESVTIYGLSANDTYTVKETDGKVTTDHYTVSYVVNGTAATDGKVEDTKLTTKEGALVNANVTVENTLDAATPGGVIMTIAPYALMVVLAGAFAVVFLSRRNRAE